MKLSLFDGFAQTLVVAAQQGSPCSENSLDESGERRQAAAHTMANHFFPSTTFPHSNC